MADPSNWYDDWPLTALLRLARRTYGEAIREALGDAGCDDLPRNGPYLISGIARSGAPLSSLIKQMGVSKQAAGQLVDVLVARGYLDRAVDSEDRRRLRITLTERGQAAAEVVRSTVERVTAQLEGRVGKERVTATMATLASLIEAHSEGRGHLHRAPRDSDSDGDRS